jgi:hypothetical protein
MSPIMWGLVVWGVVALILLGWLVPLIVGVRRRRHSAGGKVLIGVGAAWFLLAAGLVGMAVKVYREFNRSYNREVAHFDASAYNGPVGTLSFAYGLNGELEFGHEGPDGVKTWTVALSNDAAVVPAGRLSVRDLSFSPTDSSGKTVGFLRCRLASKNETFTLETNGQYRVAGGLPLTASVDAAKRGEELSLSFKLVDTAGNRFTWYATGEGRKPPTFEAVGPSGNCFWRDKFEYG